MKNERKGLSVLARTGRAIGRTTGGAYPCRLEGCLGQRVAVRWADGRVTYPCTRGMRETSNGYWAII